MKAQLDGQVAELQTLLTSRLAGPPLLTFAMLKQAPEVPPFDPGALGDAWPVPRWEDYAPPPPGALSGLVGGKARYARAREAASETFQQALADHGQAEAERGRQLQAARAHGATRITAVTIYAASGSALFGVSALYHRGNWSAAWSRRLQRADHVMIFFLIAGTATPAFLLATRGAFGLACLITLWALTLTAAAIHLRG